MSHRSWTLTASILGIAALCTPAPTLAEEPDKEKETKDAPSPHPGGNKDKAARCQQLMAQGQVAMAAAEGCGGGDTPPWAGSTLTFGQTTAPLTGTLPDNDNHFYALSFGGMLRWGFTPKASLIVNASAAYEVTTPDMDDVSRVRPVDTRATLLVNLGKYQGFNFSAGPRITVPTSRESIAANVIGGTGVFGNIVRPLDVMHGMALSLGASYQHNWATTNTREIRGNNDDPITLTGPNAPVSNEPVVVGGSRTPTCTGTSGASIPCPAGALATVQDAFRLGASASVNMLPKLSVQMSYLYAWNLARKLEDTGLVIGGETIVEEVERREDSTRWRRWGSLSYGASYEAASWLTATASVNTTVCYNFPLSFQDALGGCAGGLSNSAFFDRNPVFNRSSTVSLTMAVPIDPLIKALRGPPEEKKAVAKLSRR